MIALGPVFFTLAPLVLAQALPSDKKDAPLPASQCTAEVEIEDPRALGFERVRLVRWVDADTVKLPAPFCRVHEVSEEEIAVSEKIRGDKPGCSARLLRVNAAEKAGTSERKKDKDPGAKEGWEFMEGFVGTQIVWIKMGEGGAGYGREAIEQMLLPKEGKIYIDVFKEALRQGWAHAYVYAPDKQNVLPEYLPCQQEAQDQNKGLWQFMEYRGTFNMTSFHANGRRSDRFPKEMKCGKGKEPDPNANCEYFRLTNTSRQTVDLKDYKLKKHIEGVFSDDVTMLSLPSCEVPPGISVQIFSGDGTNQADYAKEELVLFLQQKEEFWPNDGVCAIVEGPDGKTETFRPSEKEATCPDPDYRKKQQ